MKILSNTAARMLAHAIKEAYGDEWTSRIADMFDVGEPEAEEATTALLILAAHLETSANLQHFVHIIIPSKPLTTICPLCIVELACKERMHIHLWDAHHAVAEYGQPITVLPPEAVKPNHIPTEELTPQE